MKIYRITIVLLFLFAINIKAQNDFTIKLNENEINNALNAIISARGLNFGDYTGGFGLADWYANINGASIDILTNNQVKINVTDMAIAADINIAVLSFTSVEHLSGEINGIIKIIGNHSDGYKLVIDLTDISNLSSWGDLSGFPAIVGTLIGDKKILNYIPEINLSLTSITPNVFSSIFISDIPNLTTDQNNVFLNYSIKGGRFVTVRNEVEGRHDIGKIYDLESNNFISYNSPHEFIWDLNSNHTFKGEASGIDYQAVHYKFRNWKEDNSTAIQRNNEIIDKDKTFTADYKKSFNVTFNAKPEGYASNGGTITLDGVPKNLPLTEYIFTQPYGSNIIAPLTHVENNKSYNFFEWSDGVTTPVRTISPTSNMELSALYKGTQLSNNVLAFANNNQRKIVKIRGGEYISVYESMGKIWIEKLKTDGNWELLENGDLASDIYECKNPSVAASGNNLFIVFQENVSNTSFNVRLMALDVTGNSAVTFDNEIVRSENEVSYDNVNPVIAIVNSLQNTEILMAWKENGNTLYPSGIYYSSYRLSNQDNQLYPVNYFQHLGGTDINSYNPSLSALNDQSGILTYHLTWQQNISSSSQAIKYTTITDNNGTLSIGTIETPSSGSGYTKNYSPTITVMNNDVVRVGWVGYRFLRSIRKTSESKARGTRIYQAVQRERTASGWSSVFYKLGAKVSSVNINVSDDNNSVFGWTESSSSRTGKYVINKSTQYQTIGNSIDYIQISNGATVSDMKISTFDASTPPYPIGTETINYSPAKTKTNIYSYGREGIISKDEAEFYFVIGDVNLNGNNVAFRPITVEPDSNNYFSYLESESMSVNDNSSLTYSVLYGFVDSMKVANLLSKNKEVTFQVEMTDANTGELLGVYDKVTYNNSNLYQYDNIAYSLNMKGIGNREIKLRLRIEKNIGGKYTIGDITSEEELIPKTSVKELSYQGALAVKEYALEQNYPNPFNPNTRIRYQLPKDGNVKLVIYDMLGREVKTLVNGYKRKGRYEVQFNASGLSSGVYIYKIRADDYVASKKLLLIK